ncbi:MAG: DUF5916 domain-containing protein [Gemmatimonadota bacterium]|nr:DUF5916 domain-containing protein [Gemmatimonadota bacterium]
MPIALRSIQHACAGLLLVLVSALAVHGQPVRDTQPLVLHRMVGPIEIDGRLDEEAWRALEPLPMVAYEPVAGEPPSEHTEFRIGYDDRYLYVGAVLGEDDPEDVTLNTYTRDRWANDDLVEIVIDGYNDNETGVILSVNPAGTRLDAQVSHDAEFTFGSPINYSWDAFWDAATELDERGWTAEVRIPFSSLRFQQRSGRVVMGLILSRYIAEKNETVTFPAIDPSWSFGYNKPSQARDVELVGIEPARPLYLSPYLAVGSERRYAPAPPGGEFPVQASDEVDVGADLRYALTDNLNLDVTVNPDFAQAEADDQQVNLDRFSLFFPEKRSFFQERAGIFEFRTGQNNRLFHSRRIGIVDGMRIPILGGARVVGRVGSWDLAALDMQTTAEGDVPAENFAVARVRRQVLNPYSHLGGMLTVRSGDRTNVAYGLDGTVRLGGSTYALLGWAQSYEDGRGDLSSSTGRLTVENRSREALGYRLELGRTGENYAPGIGFVQRSDYRQVAGEVRFGFLPGDESWIQRIGPRIEALYLVRDSDGELETAEVTAGGQLETDAGLSVSGGVSATREALEDGFRLGGGEAEVPAGRYDFLGARTFVATPSAAPLHASLFARVGRFFDGTATTLNLSPRWRVSPRLLWGVDFEHNEIEFASRQQRFSADIFRLRATASLSTRLSARAFVQYNSSESLVSSNLRARFNFEEGKDLWIVYDEARNTVDTSSGRRLPDTRGRTLLVKYSHVFAL